MSPTPRRRGSKSAAEPDKVEPETPDAAEDGEAAAKPKRPRRRAARKDEPAAAAASEETVAKSEPKVEAPAAKAEAPAAKAKAAAAKSEAKPAEPEAAAEPAPAAEPEEEPVKTQGDKAAEQDLEPAAAEAEAAPAAPKARRTRRAKADETPAEPAPAPKRLARDPNAGPPMVRAHAKYVRTSARKARLVCDHIRGKSVEEARAILAHANRDVARDWTKLLESAVANAEHNHELVGDDLRIHAVKADEGPTLKRFRPRAMGRATPIRKRTSHLSITLTPKDGE